MSFKWICKIVGHPLHLEIPHIMNIKEVMPQSSYFLTNNMNHDCNNLSILVWNVQEVSSENFLLTLKELIHKYNPTILALVETKLSRPSADNVCNRIRFGG